MRRRTSLLATMMLTVLPVLVGCGKIRYPAYYTLNLTAPPDPPCVWRSPTSIAVREFQSPKYLQQGTIVYRTAPRRNRLLRISPLGRRPERTRDVRDH